MKKFLLLVIWLSFSCLPAVAQDCCDNCPSNIIHPKTFFNPRQVTFDSTYELALTNYALYHAEKENQMYFVATPFYQQSTNAKDLARYFLPNGKSCISIDQDGSGDVDPIWLQLMGQSGTPYKSSFSIRPRSRSGGLILYACFDLHRWRDSLENFWLSLNTTILYVRHALRMSESPSSQAACPENSSMCTALNNPSWCAGKFCSAHRTGLDDIQIKFGYDWYRSYQDGRITAYLVGGVPTGKRSRSKSIFEPLVGSKHVSLGLGLNTESEIWQSYDRQITWMMDLKYRYVFRARERRSFDMCKNLDWSRYLLLASEEDPVTPLPAINFLTFDVKVTPGSTVDFWTALHYQHKEWHVELGYDLWWRSKENICFDCDPALTTLGIYDIAGAAILSPVSASTANISQSIGGSNPVVSNTSFVTLTNKNINLCSAEHPNAVSNKIYLAIDHDYEYREHPFFVGFGASYEFATPKRSALAQWALFLKLGSSF